MKSGSTGTSDSFLITSAEGRLQLVGGVRFGSGAPSARLEKGVDSHRGACLSGRWSHDGAGIVTGGEDGAVKIWSRSGMLRYRYAQGCKNFGAEFVSFTFYLYMLKIKFVFLDQH